MTPEELISEEKEFAEEQKIYPPFLVEQFRKGRERRRKNLPQSFSKVTDFTQVIRTVWVISNKDYQERFWVRQEPPIIWADNYMETMETFLSDGEAALEANEAGRVEMTPKQREMLQKLYDKVDNFDGDGETPDDPGYGVNDAAIIQDPKWHEIREYAKLVYEELSGDDLDAWERSRPKRAKPLNITRKEITPEEWAIEEKKIYPHFLIEEYQKLKQIERSNLYNYFVFLLRELWEMSNKDFQERFWVRKEYPIYDDKNCMKTVADFFYDVDVVLIGNKQGKIQITSKEKEMLQTLRDLVKDFESDPKRPDNPGYGINDAAMIQYPKWQEVRKYAKLVCEEITGQSSE